MKYIPVIAIMVIAALVACGPNEHSSIYDFNNSLRPYLLTIVNKGVAGYDSAENYIEAHISDVDLRKLSRSEHPVLRTVAFRIMLERPSFDHFNIIMNNLDDTAVVAIDAGEFGIEYKQVSDDLIWHGRWKDSTAFNKTIDELILRHNHLISAYSKLDVIELKDSYYPMIREMAQEDFYDIGRPSIEHREIAWEALAKYRKKEDIEIINQAIRTRLPFVGLTSFWVMEKYPDTAYMEILETYYRKHFNRAICKEENFDIPGAFIRAVASYKNNRSKELLTELLDRKPFVRCCPRIDTGYVKNDLYNAIWNNPCPQYEKLRKRIAKYMKEQEKGLEGFPIDNVLFSEPDTLAEPVRWW
jgi:hypothetical protein